MDQQDHLSLWITFPVDGWGTVEDLEVRNGLEEVLTELLTSRQLAVWQGSGQGAGTQDISYWLPSNNLDAVWELVRAKLAQRGVLQRATVEVFGNDDSPPRQLWPHHSPDPP
jgi:hypothetical protein